MPTYKFHVKGKVQGVNFRASTREQAIKAGLTGYVRNLNNGDVEIVVSGTDGQIDQLLDWCKKGPALAEVRGLVAERLAEMKFGNFEVLTR